MLNNTSTTQLVQFNNIFRNTGIDVTENTTGKIFGEDNFAKDWDSIYVRPSVLSTGKVSVGMRKLTKPTLLVTTNMPEMALVLATEEEPVFIRPFDNPFEKSGYLLAYSIMPHISPEFVYYMCKYGVWDKIINNINVGRIEYKEHNIVWGIVDGDVNWKNVGNNALWCGESENPNELASFESAFPFTASMLKNAIGDFPLPSREKQNELVEAAKEQEAKFASYSEPKYTVSELVDRYTMYTHSHGLFSNSAIRLLLECYILAAGKNINKDVVNILSEYPFQEGVLDEEEIYFLSQNLEELFQQIISANNVAYQPSLGFIQPQEVTDFMCEIASFPKDVVVYNPFAGANSYSVSLPNHIEGEEFMAQSWALGQIRLFAAGATARADIKLADSFDAMSNGKKYKAIISSPAYLNDKDKRIGDIIAQLYDKLEDGGTLVSLVSANFLTDKRSSVQQFRKKLIDDKSIRAVIQIPSNIFTYSGVSQAAIVLTKGVKNEYVIFADASGYTRYAKSVYRQTTFDWEQFLRDMEDDVEDYWDRGSYVEEDCISAPLPYDKIVDTDLTPARYLIPMIEGIKLSELATEVSELRGKEASAEYFITGSSIPASMHRKPFVPNKSENGKISTAKNHIQVPGDAVILAMVSGEPRTVYTENFNGKIAFPGGFIKVLKPAEGVSAKYLAALMATKPVADQIKALCSGTVIPRLHRLDISSIVVPNIESTELREKLISEVISSEMSELEGELQQAYDSRKREVRSTRHAMIQTLSALSSNWGQLRMFSDLKGGKIDLADVVGRVNPISVEKLMDSIGYAISTLERQVESLRFEKTDWGAETEINPYVFINDYIDTHSTPHVRMVNKGKENVADFPYFDDETGDAKYHHTDAAEIFYAPAKLLERIFNNIVANAKAHGFSADSNNNEIRFDWMSENGDIVITIANNGRPLKDGVSGDDVLMNGFSTALNEDAADGTLHSGQGGFEIKSLMEGLGTVQVISEPDSEFPVIYKLTFEKTNFEIVDLED